MIKSMTGFGRSEIASGNRKIMVEIEVCESQIFRSKYKDA